MSIRVICARRSRNSACDDCQEEMMGQILGLGITHYPGLTAQGNLCRRIKICLADPALPEKFRSMDNWPEPMRAQWAADDGQAHSNEHRQAMIEGFRRARRALDEFNPDFCVI